MIYAMSDIHGCLDALEKKMKYVDLSGDNRLIFLGDYIDYGPKSGQVLRYIYDLQQKHGEEKVIVLKGNHEALFLEFLDDFNGAQNGFQYGNWLQTDSDSDMITMKSLVSEKNFALFSMLTKRASFSAISREAAELIKSECKDLIFWIRKMPLFLETEKQIFVHAGVDEEAGEDWRWGTSDDVFLWKYPPETGGFVKDIIAGHVGTGIPELQNDENYHGIYHDGKSHYYIDGTVYKKGGTLNLLIYCPKDDRYGEVDEAGKQRWL